MKRIYTSLFQSVLLSALLMMMGCERRPLEDQPSNTALIPVKIDWSLAELNPDDDPGDNVYSASVWLFANDGNHPFAGKSYREYNLITPRGGDIEVPVGSYSVIIFNNAIADYSTKVGFRGTEEYATFEYYIRPYSAEKATASMEQEIVNEPDILAAWSVDRFVVTPEMVGYTRSSSSRAKDSRAAEEVKQLTNVKPVLLTPAVQVMAYVERLGNASAASGVLRGMASSVFLANAQKTGASSFRFLFNNPCYDEQQKQNGTIEGNFRSLGPLLGEDAAQYDVLIRFTLCREYEASLYYPAETNEPLTFDVTGQVARMVDNLKIYLKIGSSIGGDDPDISLPDIDKPGDVGVGVGEWGPDINIPMN